MLSGGCRGIRTSVWLTNLPTSEYSKRSLGPKRTPTRQGAFFGPDDERSVQKHHFFVAGSSQWSKKIQFNARAVLRVNHLDLDFGGGRKYPRVSPAAPICSGQEAPRSIPAPEILFELTAGVTYQPTNELRTQLNLVKQTLRRRDTGLTAFDVNILTFVARTSSRERRSRAPSLTTTPLTRRVRAQLLAGWTPSPGTSFYVGYNDDLNYSEPHPFSDGRLFRAFVATAEPISSRCLICSARALAAEG